MRLENGFVETSIKKTVNDSKGLLVGEKRVAEIDCSVAMH